MGNEVKLSARANLEEILKDFDTFRDRVESVKKTMNESTKEVSDGIQKQTKSTQTFFQKLRGVSAEVGQRIKEDFKALLALNALTESLKLSEQFKGSIREAVTLNDTIRKNSRSLGILKSDMIKFQSAFADGLGEIGLSSEAGANALEELVKTPVRGQKNLVEYAKTAGMLATLGGKADQGKEGQIAGGMSRVIQARGGKPNDLKEMERVAQSVKQAMTSTGESASKILGSMESLYTSMSADFRKNMAPEDLAKLSSGAAMAGPNATSFLEEYFKMGEHQRAGMEAQGIGKLFKPGQGFDPQAIKKFGEQAKALGGGNLRLGMHALGVSSDEAAEGAVRLVESLDRVMEAQNALVSDNEKLASAYRGTLTLGEAFRANINRLKKFLALPISLATEGLTRGLTATSESTGGAAAAVAGGGVLAALLAGGGLRAIGGMLKGGGVVGGLAGTVAKGAAASAVTGKDVQPVYVVNAAEIGAAGSAGSLLGGMGGKGGKVGSVLSNVGNLVKGLAPMALKGAGVGAAAYGGYKLGEHVVNPLVDKTQMKTKEGFEGNAIEALLFKLDKLFNTERYQQFQEAQEVTIRLQSPELKETKSPGRGAAY